MTEIIRLPRTSKRSTSGNGKVVRKHIEKYRVKSDTQLDPYSAGQLIGIYEFDQCPYDGFASCRDISVEEELKRNPFCYLVTVEYSTDTPDRQQSEEDNPLNDPVEIESSSRDEKRSILFDRDGKAILNLAGDYYDPTIQVPISNTVFTFTRNEPAYSYGLSYAYLDHTNGSTFLDAEPDQIKCTRFHARKKSRNKITYYEVTYEFEHSRFGWQPQPLEQGKRMIFRGKKVDIPDEKTGLPISQAVPLIRLDDPVPGWASEIKYYGELVQAGDVIPIPSNMLPDEALYTEHPTIPQAEFSNLGLPV